MKSLTVFRGVPIPVDYATTQTYALLAKRGGGKTYTTLKFEEQLCDAGLFFVTLDPVGKHWALRAGADGSDAGGKNDVWVLGGQHGDVPLDPRAGELIADIVVEHPGRYVLDVSTFETDADQDRFALAFAKRLFRRKAKGARFPLLLILEEAESFIPERAAQGQQPMLGAFARIIRQGRNHGLGMWMVAQRAQALNKGVLSQAEVLIAMQMAHKRDRDAVDDWVKANGTKEQRDRLMDSLASLEPGDAWVWSPSWLRVFERTRVLPRVTFDSSANIAAHEELDDVELTPLDPDALGERMQQVAERAKADDPRELRKRIAELERELTKRPTEEVVREVEVEIPAVSDDQAEELRELVEGLGEHAGRIIGAANEIAGGLRKVTGRAPRPEAAAPAPTRAPQPARPPRTEPPREPVQAGDFRVTPAQQRILNALAMLEAIGVTQADKTQLALFAGASPKSSGYSNNLGALRNQAGLITYPSGGTAALTDEGRAIADAADAPRTVDEMLEYVRSLVGPARARIIDALVSVYPEALTREELADRAGASATSSGFSNNLGSLRTLGLIDYPERGLVVAQPVLFLEAAA